VGVVGHAAGLGVDGDQSAADADAVGVAVEWSLFRVEGDVPQHYAVGPVAGPVDEPGVEGVVEGHLLAGLPVAAGGLGEVGLLARVVVVGQGLVDRGAAVDVPAGADRVVGGGGVVEDRLRVRRHVPVVVPGDDLRGQFVGRERLTHLRDQLGLLGGG